MSSPQRSKRARTLNLCPDCGQKIINQGAHAEACPGRPVREDWTGWYGVSGLCGCGWRRDGGRCAHGNPYVPVMRRTA